MIYIVFDTNTLYNSSTNYSDFSFGKNLDLIMNFLQEENLTNECSLLIPQIVIDELKQQQKEHFLEDHSKIDELLKKQGDLCEVKWNIEISEYEEYIDHKIKNLVKHYEIVVAKACSEKSFDKILCKALKKEPPFEGVEKKSDKGFKDAVIWQSLIEFSIQAGGSYIFYTNDNIFLNNKRYLCKEFDTSEYRKIEFLKNIDEIQQYILKELELNSTLNKYFERITDIKDSKCLDIFFNGMESFPDLFIVDGEVFHLRMINYDLKNIRMPSLRENESLIHVDAEIGVFDDLSEIFCVLFELTVTKINDKWKVSTYELISKDNKFTNMAIDIE